MTKSEALDFFYKYGNVGRTRADLSTQIPTSKQLYAAGWEAVYHQKQPVKITNEAIMALGGDDFIGDA